MSRLAIDINPILRSCTRPLNIRRIALEQGLVHRAADLLRDLLPPGSYLLVADQYTWAAAGLEVAAGLEQGGIRTRRYLVEPARGEARVVADEVTVQGLEEHLRLAGEGIAAVVAVGAGTINDIAKLATHRAGIPYAAMPTDPSMNGYTSGIAAILSGGVKTTQPCHQPLACLVDLDVVAQAPYRMIASGLGDLLSRPVSHADWRLSHLLLDSEYSPEAAMLIDSSADLLRGVVDALPRRDLKAVGRLAASLCISGLAMGAAGSSAPASSGEHLISHYLDMTRSACGESHDLHGCQVGVATITTAALYQQLAALDPACIDVETRLAVHQPWPQYVSVVQRCFGSLSAAVLPHARAAYPAPEELRQRLSLLKSEWNTIVADLGQILQPPQRIREELQAGQAPVKFSQIGVSPARALQAVLHGKDIRARYTILHLSAELGLLESWTEAVLAEFH